MKTYQVINALDGAGLETRLNDAAADGYELQALCVTPSTALLAVVRKRDQIEIKIEKPKVMPPASVSPPPPRRNR